MLDSVFEPVLSSGHNCVILLVKDGVSCIHVVNLLGIGRRVRSVSNYAVQEMRNC